MESIHVGGRQRVPALDARTGSALTFVSNKAGPDNMYRKPLDGSGPEERLAGERATELPVLLVG